MTECKVCGELARRTGTDARDWHPVFKARYGMEVAFRLLRETAGPGRVATQLFTCCTAVDPIVQAGFEPWYVDVDRDTLSIDVRRWQALLEQGSGADSTGTAGGAIHAAVLQHTFGLMAADADRSFVDLAHAHDMLVVEDCAHCVGRLSRGADGEPLADVSVHSFGVEKMMPTHFGGALWVNPRLAHSRPRFHRELCARLAALPQPGARLDIVTKLYFNSSRVFSRLGSLGATLRSAATRMKLFEPPIAACEREGGLAYRPMGVTTWIDATAAKAIGALDGNERSRQSIVAMYRGRLRDMPALEIPQVALEGEPLPLLRFPLFAADTEQAERLIAAVRATGAYAERWYRPELFPGVTNAEAYGLTTLDRSTVAVSDELVSKALCLPTELSEHRAKAVCDALLAAVA